MKYNVREEIGVNSITSDDGQKVYSVIYPELHLLRTVELDFTDVKIVASPFLNAAIGQLLKEFTPEQLNKYLKITNLSVLSRPILRRVIENAKDYYGSDIVRQAVDSVIAEKSRTDVDKS